MKDEKSATIIIGIIGAIAIIVAAIITYFGNVAPVTLAISATQTAEARFTQIAWSTLTRPTATIVLPSKTPAATVIATQTQSPTPSVKLSPSASPSRLILTSTPDPVYGTKRRVDTTSGRLSIYKHQAIAEYLHYTNDDRGKNLCVYIESYGHPMRIELWNGSIPWGNTSWWGDFQMVTQDPPGTDWQSKVNPKLFFPVVPGDYTLYIIRWIQEDQASSIIIDYNISLLASSCPQNFS